MPRPTPDIAEAYRQMARQASYRPAAPSDGFGHITGRLDLKREQVDYAAHWRREEDTGRYALGCPSYEGRKLLIYLVEAARCVCGTDYTTAARLVDLAADVLAKGASHD